MVLTMASLACLIVIGLAGMSKTNGLSNTYFLRANTSHVMANASLTDVKINYIGSDINGLTAGNASNSTQVAGFYQVYLWNYCSGNGSSSQNETITYCSPRQNEFWFDPVSAWGLNETGAEQLFGKELTDGLNIYKNVAKWMFLCYLIAIISTAAEILVGISSLFSRLGALATTIVSSVSSLFLIAFAITATALYASLVGTFNGALRQYDIRTSLGTNMLVLMWLAVAFSWASGIFWCFASCCCSGRSDRIRGYNNPPRGNRGMLAEHTPYNYDRLEGGAPHAQQAVPMLPVQPTEPRTETAYEPYRHA